MGVQPSIRQIGKYTVLDVIGTGGMGIVFRAQDPAIGRTVAIKMLKNRAPGDTQDVFDRFFLREMKSTGNLHHKNIVTVYDAGEQDGSPYLVMEYLEGEPVSKLISERRPLPLLEKLDLVIQVCDGLQYAHDRNIVHRDIKPANVILLADRSVKIVDFGVARIAGSETSLAQTGQLVGSLSYMSPEQINSLPLDGRSDIFSTGVMLYELLTNEVPFKGSDPSSTFVKILREEPLPLSKFIPDIPPAMQAVMNRALAKNAQDRYQSAEEFGFDLLGLQRDMEASTAADCLKRGEAAMQRGDLDRARVLLGDVIRLDRHNERANRLLREIRSAIQTQQRSGQVIQIRSQAQVALAGGQFEEALACADQALRLNPDDTESIKLCDQIRNAISLAKAVRDALNRAEAALFAGDFDEAKEAVEESLRLNPSDSEARALASVVNKELQERFRRKQVQEFVDQARQGIAERKFNDALDALHRAEELDPTDSNVRELLQWAQRGQEQENRRRYLQDIMDQIEKALHAGDFSSACTIVEMGLQRIPGEPTLIRLRAISEKQRDIAERRRFVHDQSLAVKALTDEDKLYDAVQVLTEALRKFPGEPNLESLLAITKAAIERQQFEREEAARKKAVQRAENEARAELTQQVLNWSVELRRSLDARAALGEVIKISKELRVALEGKQVDDHAREVASLVLNEVNARMRARDQAMVELEHLHRAIERSLESLSVTETESRLLSIKAAFPNEANIQRMCADLANSIARVREARDHSISLLGDLAQVVETTPTSELTALQEKARQFAADIASDPRAGALLQQIDSSVNRRFERRAELVRDVTALLASLSKVHSLDEISRISDRATAIAALDPTDDELADQSRRIDAEARKVRDAMESLLRDMAALGREVASAPTIRDADALVPRVKGLADRGSDFQTLQEAATRILAEAQGRRIEHDLIVQELEATLTAIPLLETDEELSAAASRAVECRELHGGEPAIHSLSGQVAGEVERILRERSELGARQAECDNAIRTAEERLRSHELEPALEVLLTVEAQNPDRVDLQLQISLVRRAIEQRRLEQELLEEEQRAREQAEEEQRACRRAIEEAIQRAQELISAGQGEESLQCLRTAMEREPGNQELESALELTLAEVARHRTEQERLERERLAREQAEANARARKEAADQAIEEGWELLLLGRSTESLQCLQAALERDSGNPELEAELQSIVAEIARKQAEQERLERERLAREQAEAEAQARKAAADKAIHEGRALLAQGQNLESVQCFRSALQRDPGSQELEAELQSTLAEIARQQAELERLAREAAEAQARRGAAERAIQEAGRLLAQGQGEESVQCLRSALERDPGNEELESALELTLAEVARQQAERERLRREEAEARARKMAGEQAIEEAMRLLAQGQGEDSLQRVRLAQERDPKNKDLRSTLESIQAEIERREVEQERLERERIKRERLEKERAEAEVAARKAAAKQAIDKARKLLAKGKGEESLQCVSVAFERDPESADLRAALESIQAEVDAERAEEARLAWEQAERERIAREQAETEARARKEAVDRAVREAHELLAQGRGEEALQPIRYALQHDPENHELHSAFESMQAEVAQWQTEQEWLEKERLERERLAMERAEAEERARSEAAEQAIGQAHTLLEQGEEEECLQCLHAALSRDPESVELRSWLEMFSSDIDQRRAERERLERARLERERIEQEKAAAESRARQEAAAEAIQEARALLADGLGEKSIESLRLAIEKDSERSDLRSALEDIQGEIARRQAEQERIAKETAEAEARAREAAADKAITEAHELLVKKRGVESLQCIREALGRDPDNLDLQSALQSIHAEVASQRAEQERLERERIAKEKAAAQARARQAAAEQSIKEALELFAQGRTEESLQRLNAALDNDSGNLDLRATLNSIQAEIARKRAEQERQERERLERERIAKEKAEAEARERKIASEKAIKEAQELLTRRRGKEALQCVVAALGRDPDNQQLQSAVQSIQAELDRQRAEQERLERERLERERIAKEKAEAEARARQAASEQAIKEARAMFAENRGEESVQRLRVAVDNDPSNPDLRSTLNSFQTEIARRQAEQDRLERERLGRERVAAEKAAAEARARKAAADKAIKEARSLLAKKRGAESLQGLREAMGRDPDSKELQAELNSIQVEVERQSAELKQQERERLERERIAAEKADAEARARKAAAEKAIKEARALLDQGRSEESLQKIRMALETDPKNAELRSTLDSIQEEIARQLAEKKRLERARAKEKAAADALARKAEADKKKSESAQFGVSAGKAPKTQTAGSVSKATEDRKRGIVIGAIAAGVLVVGGIVYVVFHHSTPIPGVTFAISPADSALTVDGNSASCPGQCTLKLTPGRHSVKLEKPGFIKDEISITVVTPPEPIEAVTLALKPIPNPNSPPTSLVPSLAIVSNVDTGSVTLDRDSRGNLPGSLDLGQLDPGTHLIVVSENGQRLIIPVKVSDAGGLNIDGASGPNQVAVVSVMQVGNDVSIYCRCFGAGVQVDGKKPKPSGPDRYSFSTHGRAAFNLTVQPIGNFKPIPIYVADATHAAIHVEPFVQIAAPPPPQPPVGPTPVPDDQKAYEAAKASRDPNVLRQFVAMYPNSLFVKPALEETGDLKWETVRGSNQPDDYTNFAKEYPDNSHASEARAKADQIARERKEERDRLEKQHVIDDAKKKADDDAKKLDADEARRALEAKQRDRDAINQALENYRSAYERKDLNSLSFVWPNPPQFFKQQFNLGKKFRVSLEKGEIAISGDTATVPSTQTLDFTTVDGKPFHQSLQRLFTLKRVQGRWIILKDN